MDCFFLGGDFPAFRLTFQSNSCYALSGREGQGSTDLLLSEREKHFLPRCCSREEEES